MPRPYYTIRVLFPRVKTATGGQSIRDTASHPITQIMVRALPQHTTLKIRQPGQNTVQEILRRDLREALTKQEQDYFDNKKKNKKLGVTGQDVEMDHQDQEDQEDAQHGKLDLKKVLAKAASLDADDTDGSSSSDDSGSDSDSDGYVLERGAMGSAHLYSHRDSSSDEEEDDTAELLRELEKIKKERKEEQERQEQERMEKEMEQREQEAMQGNPLLRSGDVDFTVKRRFVSWECMLYFFDSHLTLWC